MKYRSAFMVAAALALATGPASADSDVTTNVPPPTHLGHTCIKTTVKSVHTRLASMDHGKFIDQAGTGFSVIFSGKIADPYFGALDPGVVHYQGDPADRIMSSERPGDRVIVCVIGFPNAGDSCDPAKDPRGRTMMVYDFKLRTTYVGQNSEHGCGGA